MARLRILAGLLVILATTTGLAQEKSVKPGINDSFKNPDVDKYKKTFEGESREISTSRKAILEACQIKPGMAIADVGAGTGLFTRLFAEEVGPKGKVYAVDIAKNFLQHIEKTARDAKLSNIQTILCNERSSELPPASVDLVFICDTYHHFEFPLRTMSSIHKALRPGGRLVLIDFHRIPGKSREWTLGHVRAGQEVFEKEVISSGFKKVGVKKVMGLEENYFVHFEKVEPKKEVRHDEKLQFNRDIRPILADACFTCHGPDKAKRKGDLRLDTEEGRASLVPGKPGESELFQRLVSADPSKVMPPAKSNRKLRAEEVENLRRWIEQGGEWQPHWAYLAPVRPGVPAAPPGSRSENPIDPFVHARMASRALTPSGPAAPEELLRRVTLDLTGLPPTPEEVDAFVHDTSPGAYEKVVERLLASPRFGERMAWDWLDAARYADSNGYQGDSERTMWPWRDWVVRAFNDNMPYDRFTVDQMAGDLIPGASREQILATAFNRNHMINGEGGRIAEENRIEYLFDQTETMGTVWLGLTLNCSRCHDHKYDPLSRRDYYSLLAFFNRTPIDGGGGSGQTAPILEFANPEQELRRKTVTDELAGLAKKVADVEARLRDAGMTRKDGKYATTYPQVIESALRKGPNDRADQNVDELVRFFKEKEPAYVQQLEQLRRLRRERDAQTQSVPRVMVMNDMPKPRDTFLLTRGAYDKREGKVTADVPRGLPPLPPGSPDNRLALARWLVSPENPLPARVTVNRIWQMLFGMGLVKTTEDFGVQGDPPSHPELLDWLAVEFRDQGWDVKKLIRRIVTSDAYRRSSRATPDQRERDPDNRLLARAPRFRLPSWMLRDQALAVSGLLAGALGGPPVKPYQPAGIWEEATFGNKSYRQDHGEALYRRSLYVFWRRIVGPTLFFDTANRQTCSVKSVITNTPLHALTTLNDTTYVEAARALAQRSLLDAPPGDEDRLGRLFRLVTSRSIHPEERAILKGTLQRQREIFTRDPASARKLLQVGESPRQESIDPVEHAAWTAVCSLILNLDETLNRP